MKKVFDLKADIELGKDDNPDWRKEGGDETDSDDEELDKTPEDVIALLGFDPKLIASVK